ncbi:50S ribosomal protein L24 [Candidatus Poriferisodalis sp.]|uniref:50S ribosomal protein L24 n=1 Tax=Candidatus Poriferisodalis sp. TaxID=3101277 RepID=UPI003B5B713F
MPRQRNQLPRLRVRKGDTVRVISGPDRGREGEVVSVDVQRRRLTVEGVNVGRKHERPSQQNQDGQIIDYLLPIDASNVAVVCPRTGQPGRVGFRFEGGRKVRYHRVSGEELP